MTPINLSQITLDDALNDPNPLSFDPPVRPPLTTRITCRVCDRTEDVPIGTAAQLCTHCRADLDATERHIHETLEAAETALSTAWCRWDADLAQSDDRERYARVCAAKEAGAPGFAEKYARAIAKGDGLSVLLIQSEAVEVLFAATERTRGWAERALEEVREARDGL